MKDKNIRRHCPEVEKLMGGKMPFVTRHGITLVLLTLILVAIILFSSKGAPQQLMEEIIEYTLGQITSKI